MISFQCMTVGPTKEIAENKMKPLYPLFRLMGNDIILHNKYADEEILKTTKEASGINKLEKYLLIQGILISVFFTWGLGLFIPLIIRFIFKKKLSKSLAILTVSIIWLIQFIIAEVLSDGQGNKHHTALLLVAVAGYNIIVKKDLQKDKNSNTNI